MAPDGIEDSGVSDLLPDPGNPAFDAWIGTFRERALREGIRAEVFDRAFDEVRFRADVLEKDRTQAEFTKQIWDYLDSAVSEARIENGIKALEEHGRLLERIENRFGVEKEIVVAVWGMESAYGAFRGTEPVVEALATLAFDGRRSDLLEAQLLDALRILQAGDAGPAEMTGSWAGAMGHTQFMPSSYLAHAVDFDGDGRRDIWGEDPADALASTAAYLAHFGWQKGQPWGVEVTLPEGFNYALTGKRVEKSVAAWMELGVRDVTGAEVAGHGRASVLLPAGARGAAFLIFDNFQVLARYNNADAYVIAVGHLADRITGGDPIKAEWPREERALLALEREELQRRLTAAGFDTEGVDGIIGPNSIAALRAYQSSEGLIPDGYPSLEVLERLR